MRQAYDYAKVTIYDATRLFAANNDAQGLLDPISLGDGPDSDVNINDIMQGGLGDCAFLAAVGALAKNDPHFIHDLIHDNGDGTATINFYPTVVGPNDVRSLSGAPAVPITVSETLDAGYSQAYLSGDYQMSAADSHREWEIWPQLLENAYTQFIGQPIDDVWAYEVWMQLTGNSAQDVKTWNANTNSPIMTAPAISTALNNLFASGASVVISSRVNAVANVGGLSYQVVADHAYTLIGISHVNGNDVMELFNPWGGDPNSPYTDSATGAIKGPVIYVPLDLFNTYFRRYQYQNEL